MPTTTPLACVLGDTDLVRPLGLAGINCAVAVPPGAASRFSRFTKATVDWANPWDEPAQMVSNLISFAQSQPAKPVLFFESDAELLMVSRNRETLGEFFRFEIADAQLVEDLVDKERFQQLSKEAALPVPPAQRLRPVESSISDLNLRYPLIVKPLTRRPQSWKAIASSGKALRVDSEADLRRIWPRLVESGVNVLAQELVAGPETQIESYHVYVNSAGDITGEFTGRKIRTYPREFGDSTALEITTAPDVAALGREIVKKLELRGVAKFDFKRAPDGTLFLLEINPRFNLWHHLGAVAGVNLPALVYADLTGQQQTQAAVVRPGVSWCRMWQDVLAARQNGLPIMPWARWAMSCEAKRLLAWDDPMPIVKGVMWRVSDWVKSHARSEKPAEQVGSAEMRRHAA